MIIVAICTEDSILIAHGISFDTAFAAMVAYHSFVIVALLAKYLLYKIQKLKADPKACLWCSLVLICDIGDDLLRNLHQHAANKHEYDFSFVHRNALLSAFALLHKDDVYL